MSSETCNTHCDWRYDFKDKVRVTKYYKNNFLTSQASLPSEPAQMALSGRLYLVPKCDFKATLHSEFFHIGTCISFNTSE